MDSPRKGKIMWSFADSFGTSLSELRNNKTSLRWLEMPLLWRHNWRDVISHHQLHDCLLNRVRGIYRWPVNSPHKWQVKRKCFHLMTSSWLTYIASEIPTGKQFVLILPIWSGADVLTRFSIKLILAKILKWLLIDWPRFRRRHFQMRFHEWKVFHFDSNFIEVCS